MNKLLAGIAALPFLAGVAMAGQPAPLSDTQMDQVTAGFDVLYVYGPGTDVQVYTNVTSPPATCIGSACNPPNPSGLPAFNPANQTYWDVSFPSLDGASPGLSITIKADPSHVP